MVGRKIIIMLKVLLLLTSCVYENSNICLEKLKKKLVIDLRPNENIDFSQELDCFEWDKLLFVDRHFDSNSIKKKTGIDISEFKLMGIKSWAKSDFYTYILFIKDKQIIKAIEVSKGVYIDDFISDLNNNDTALILKEDASFITYRTGDKYIDGREIISIRFKDKNLIDKYTN